MHFSSGLDTVPKRSVLEWKDTDKYDVDFSRRDFVVSRWNDIMETTKAILSPTELVEISKCRSSQALAKEIREMATLSDLAMSRTRTREILRVLPLVQSLDTLLHSFREKITPLNVELELPLFAEEITRLTIDLDLLLEMTYLALKLSDTDSRSLFKTTFAFKRLHRAIEPLNRCLRDYEYTNSNKAMLSISDSLDSVLVVLCSLIRYNRNYPRYDESQVEIGWSLVGIDIELELSAIGRTAKYINDIIAYSRAMGSLQCEKMWEIWRLLKQYPTAPAGFGKLERVRNYLGKLRNPPLRTFKTLTAYGRRGVGGTEIAFQENQASGEVGKMSPTVDKTSFWKRTYSKTQKQRHNAVQVTLDGHEYMALPDSGSDKNIMTEDFAKQHDISIQRHEDDKSLFQLGTGKYIQSIGRAYLPCGLSGQLWTLSSQESRWFHVLKECVAPLIVGMEFLEKTKLYTEYKHLLVNCPLSFGDIPTLKYIGSRQALLNFSADGIPLTGCLDTGADLDFMSLRAAIEHGFKIDRRPEARTRVMLPDCSIVETVGQVRTSVQISEFDMFDMTFNVLAGLPCDAIFSDDFVEQMDAFNSCSQLSGNESQHRHTLKVLINLGPLQSLFSKRRKPGAINTAQQDHDNEMETEYHRRNKAARLIFKMYDQDEMLKAREGEGLKVEMFDRIHKHCVYCRSEGPGRMLRRPWLKPPDILNSGSLGAAQPIATGHIR